MITFWQHLMEPLPYWELPLPPPLPSLPGPWLDLYLAINGLPPRVGTIGVRDPDAPCEVFDGKGYDGKGKCHSDGHYMCVECSHLSPEAPRFVEYGREGRAEADRLRLYSRETDTQALGVM